MSPEFHSGSHQVLSALLNGAYQGLLLTAVIWTGLKLLPRGNAATRHSVWLVTLAVVAALPVLHLLLSGAVEEATQVPVDSAASIGAIADHGHSNPDFSASNDEWFFLDGIPDSDFKASTRAEVVQGFDEEIPVLPETDWSSPPTENAGLWRIIPERWRITIPVRVAAFLVGAWLVMAMLRLGYLIRQYWQLRAMTRSAALAPAPSSAIFAALKQEMQIERKTRLLISSEIATPMVVGFWHPAVLLPTKMLEGAAEPQLPHVLRHELAHVARRDDWANLFQQGVKAAYFFHPVVGWLSRRLSLEREVACDDHVLAAIQAPRSYALFLTEFAGQMQGRPWAAATAAWSSNDQLKQRITMILDSKRNASPRLAKARVVTLAATATLLAAFGLYAAPRLAFAAENKTETTSSDVIQSSDLIAAVEPIASAETPPRSKPERVELPETPTPVRVSAPVPIQTSEPRAARRLADSGAFLYAAPVATATLAAPRSPSRPALAALAPPATPAAPPVQPRPRTVSALVQEPNDVALERRLDRLERMVESLVASMEGHAVSSSTSHSANSDPNSNSPKETLDRASKEQAGLLAKPHAKLADEMAASELKMEKQRADQMKVQAAPVRQTIDAQRKALEAQKSSLMKRLQELESQIDKLDQDADAKPEPKRSEAAPEPARR